jgi:hypothetical protein
MVARLRLAGAANRPGRGICSIRRESDAVALGIEALATLEVAIHKLRVPTYVAGGSSGEPRESGMGPEHQSNVYCVAFRQTLAT